MAVGIAALIFRRGTGAFKLLFAIDDLIRLFTMTLVFLLGLSLINTPRPIVMAGIALGLIIDLHDLIDALHKGKPVDMGFG